MKNVVRTWMTAIMIAILPMGFIACGDDDEQTEDNSKVTSKLEVKWENAQYRNVQNIIERPEGNDTVMTHILVIAIHLTNRTGVDLKDVTIGKGETGTNARYCMADNGKDLSSYMVIATEGADYYTDSHEVTLDIANKQEKVVAVCLYDYPTASEKSLNVSLSIACANYDLGYQYLTANSIKIIGK